MSKNLDEIGDTKSRPRVWAPRTQSREPGDKSPGEKVMWPYTSEFNRHAKNHSLLAGDGVGDTLRSGPSLLPVVNHAWAFFNFFFLHPDRRSLSCSGYWGQSYSLTLARHLPKQLFSMRSATLQCCKKHFIGLSCHECDVKRSRVWRSFYIKAINAT